MTSRHPKHIITIGVGVLSFPYEYSTRPAYIYLRHNLTHMVRTMNKAFTGIRGP
jgi:hypothetical protein